MRKEVVCAAMLFFLGSASLSFGASQPQRRIRGNIQDNQTFTLTGNTRPALTRAQDRGQVDPALPMTGMVLHFTLSAAQLADQEQLQKQQLTRRSSEYHKWLTPDQFADRFGLNSKDLEQIVGWLSREGFSNIEVAPSRTSVSFSGNASQVEAAFHVPVHRYSMHGEERYAAAADPELPKTLEGIVSSIRGLDDIRPTPHVHAHFTSSTDGSHYLTPADFATIYDVQAVYGRGTDGSNRTIAVMGQSDIDLSDIQAFRAHVGLPQNDPHVILVGPDPGTRSNDEIESDLDLEWAGAIAPNALTYFINSPNVFYSLYYVIEHPIAFILSVSYGECEADLGLANSHSFNALLLQATIEGMTVVASSGDSGPANCDLDYPVRSGLGVIMPASSPYVTAMGGTTFNEGSGVYWNSMNDAYNASATSYIPEVAWNDTKPGSNWGSSAGGASLFFTKPKWQTGLGVPVGFGRNIPDLALASSADHDGFIVCAAGACARDQFLIVGGTSVAAPAFAGIAALLQQAVGESQGNINPALYLLASYSKDAFHDIVSGNSIVPCVLSSPDCPPSGQLGFSAGPGYDQVTGLGSVDVYNLLAEWYGDFQVSVNPATLSIPRGSSANVLVAVTPEGNFAGQVVFSCSVASSLTNTACSVSGVVIGSGTAMLTITTKAAAAGTGWRRLPGFPRLVHPWVLIAVSGLLLLAGFYCWRPQPRMPVWSGGIVLLLLLVATSCGDGGTSPSPNITPVVPPETGIVTIDVVGGLFLTNSATVAVSVP